MRDGPAAESEVRADRMSVRRLRQTVALGPQCNPRVLLQSFLEKHDEESLSLRKVLREAICASETVSPIYRLAYKRYETEINRIAVTAKVYPRPGGRLLTGAGGASVLESSILLHPVYGVPLIAGSSVKGVVARYMHEVWGRTEAKFQERGEYHLAVFGDKDGRGGMQFLDAWWVPPSAGVKPTPFLVMDVLTPHHPPYYRGDRDKNTRSLIPPSDFDDPTPLAFLSATGRFLFAIQPEGGIEPSSPAKKWAELCKACLKQALKVWGIGAKTRKGYGRMEE